MKNKAIIILSALFLTGSVFTGISFAGSTKCEVTAVDGSKVTMDCGDDADNFDKGTKVLVKVKKSRKAIEGC